MKRTIGLIVLVLGLGTASCTRGPVCGSAPLKPQTIRTASVFGHIASFSPSTWFAGQPNDVSGHIVIGGRKISTDARTERFGYCGSTVIATAHCSAFVGVGRNGVADWVLLAGPETVVASEYGRLAISGVTVWTVRTTSLVLSDGIYLRLGAAFARKLNGSNTMGNEQRTALDNDLVGATLWVDPRSGDVLDASVAGCA